MSAAEGDTGGGMKSRYRRWLRAALLVGAVYFLVGKLFALPTDHVHAWRLAAWVVSAVAYAAHIGYEHFRLRNSTGSMARHVAVGVAIGAVALAVAAMIHSLSTAAGSRPVWLLALVLWPAFTALPAYLVALVAGALLSRVPLSADGE
jgi:hypothetical protein